MIQLMWLKAQGYLENWEKKKTSDNRIIEVPIAYHATRIGDLMKRLKKARISYDVFQLNWSPEYRRQIGRKLKRAEKASVS